MASPHPSDLPILEKAIAGLNAVSGSRTIANDGLGQDADISGLANPATTALLVAAIDALGGFHQGDIHVRNAASAAVELASEPMFSIAAPTIGNVTTADGGGSLADSTQFFYCVVAVDINGNYSYPSAQDDVTTGSVGNDSTNTIPWTDSTGAFKIRVFKGTTTGVYTHYKDVDDATSTTHVSDVGWTAVSETLTNLQTATAAPYNRAGYGLITNDMVDDARDAGSANFTTLRNSVADQHPLGTSARTGIFQGVESVPFLP